MDAYDAWKKALRETEIVRSRVRSLETFEDTRVPYIFLSSSSINLGDTVVRKGEVLIEKPALVLPPDVPHFDGFEFNDKHEGRENSFINFLIVRGIHLPSLRYNNKTNSLNVYEGELDKAIAYYKDQLLRTEDVHAGLISGPEDCWQLSLLIYICSQIIRNTEMDIQKLMRKHKKKK